MRAETGLAGCATFVTAPRSMTAFRDFQGRAFLHSYDWTTNTDFATLELILTAPVVVASWISLHDHETGLAPAAFGGGDKLIHNVVGGIGVLQGNGGTLCPGLPWQAVDDGNGPMHTPLRLSVMIEAPQEAIVGVRRKHGGLRDLFDNGWLHLFALNGGRIAARYRPGLIWDATNRESALAA